MKNLNRWLGLSTLALSSMLWSGLATADIYLQYGDIKGDVTESKHIDWIHIESFSWGFSRFVDVTRLSSGAQAGVPVSAEVSLSKQLDSSSTGLAMEALMGRGQSATLHFTQSGDQEAVVFLKLKLCDAYVTSLSTSGSSEGRPFESLGLVFGAFKLEYFEVKQTGSIESAGVAEWDFVTGMEGGCG